MIIRFLFSFILVSSLQATSQVSITAVNTSTSSAASSFTYANAGFTYNWGLTPNNSIVSVNGFTAGAQNYSYASFLPGTVRLRRVNNAMVTGNYTLVWAQVVTSGTVYNMFPEYQNDMEPFFNGRVYNKGTDNFFDNTSANSNNIERLDWILSGGYSTTSPGLVGFSVFERGAVGGHDPFCIAAITSLDGLGNPATYGTIVRVVAANYGDPGPTVTYRILKAQNPANLLDAGTNTQNRGGVIVSLQSLGITSGQTIYGYSLFSNDLPIAATPANLVDFTNATYFPTNTGNPGGIDLIAVTGIYIANSLLPVKFVSFSGVENQNIVKLKWEVENETTADRYEVERSYDGRIFSVINQLKSNGNSSTVNVYSLNDNVSAVFSSQLYYRIKQYDLDGSYYYSKTIALRKNSKPLELLLYPNPSAENLFVNVRSAVAEKVNLTVSNLSGLQVITQQINLFAGNNSLTVNGIDKLPPGAYQLSIQWQGGRKTTKQFIKK